MNDLIVSFCITTYSRPQKIEELVKEILQCKSRMFEVVVLDNNSPDDTYHILTQINDTRLHVYKNNTNLGPKKNWYKALNYGRAKYLFQVLDRDWIKHSEIDHLIKTLSEIDVAYAYSGLSIISFYEKDKANKNYVLYSAGIEGMKKFACVPNHPTGVIFKRENWVNCKHKKKYFYNEKWGVYPHGYVCAELAICYPGAIIYNDICDRKYRKNYTARKSQYYQKQKKYDFWWTPIAHYRDLIRATCVLDKNKFEDSIKKDIVLERFKDHIFVSTLDYKMISSDKKNANYYQIEPYEPDTFELLKIAIDFYLQYTNYLKEKKYSWYNCNMNLKLCFITIKAIIRFLK